MTLQLRGAFSSNPRVAPLVDGTVRATGIEIAWESGNAGDLHTKHLRDSAHDVFEFSISNYIVTRERPKDLWDWVMIPVFASKATLGLNTWINTDAGIRSGADLAGKRFGIPDYTMTAGLWFRAQLEALWGIRTSDVEWYIARQGEDSHGRQMGFETRPPAGVTLHWTGDGDVNRMLQAGELDAAFPAGRTVIDTSTGKVARLFADGGRRFMADFMQKTGFLPVNHMVLVQRRLVEREPWVPEALFEAFEAAKREAYRRDRKAAGVFLDGNADMDWQASVFGADPFPYGLAANRAMLEMAARQSNVDGLTTTRWDVEQFIAERLRGT
jgi:4,5-dihydroxyphthalate decarboxylase